MKKLIMMLAVAVAATMPIMAETETVGDYTWTYYIDDDTAVIYNGYYSAAISPSPTGAVTIPSTLGGKPVTGIGEMAFSGCSGLTSVTIPDSVTYIGRGAFYHCSSLADVAIGNGLTELIAGYSPDNDSFDSGVFAKCIGLKNVTFGSGIRRIGNYSFEDCVSLSNVTIPANVTTVGSEAFYGCTQLWTAWYKTLANSADGGNVGGSSYALTDAAADRAIASVTVDGDCAIDEFVLKDGKVYDSMLYVNNTANREVKLSLPSGYTYKIIKGAAPLTIPATSQCMISITRVAADVFLVMREELEDVK